MSAVEIKKVEIMDTGELAIMPSSDSENYQYIYRSATGVFWNSEKRSFLSAITNEKTFAQWYENIIDSVASELGVNLILCENTEWVNVSEEVKVEIIK